MAVAPLVAVAGLLALGTPAIGAPSSSALLTWTKLAPTPSPPARVSAALAFDAATNSTVLFGGQSGNQMLDDTWVFDGTHWAQQTPATSPPALASASMAYDNIGHRLLLFGGLGTGGSVNDQTWSWDGTTWSPVALPAGDAVPPAR